MKKINSDDNFIKKSPRRPRRDSEIPDRKESVRSVRRDSGGSDRRGSGRGRDFGRSDRREPERFGRRDSVGSERRGSRRDFGRPSRKSEQQVMYEVTCDKCGKKCEVPFKPTPSKPVYCNECFREKENSRSKDRSNEFAKEFEQINKKLDKILEAIDVD